MNKRRFDLESIFYDMYSELIKNGNLYPTVQSRCELLCRIAHPNEDYTDNFMGRLGYILAINNDENRKIWVVRINNLINQGAPAIGDTYIKDLVLKVNVIDLPLFEETDYGKTLSGEQRLLQQRINAVFIESPNLKTENNIGGIPVAEFIDQFSKFNS